MASSSFYFFLVILILIKHADTTTETPPPTYPPPPPQKQQPFKPGISVVIGVLTTMFSLTFLLLLYIKHCNTITSSTTLTQPTTTTTTPPLTAPRKNSGIDRTVIQSLPIFRFGSLMGQKDGLDCAVCLTRFEPAELLRLLPKCKHAFHVECVDTWLDAHSTCPLCRHHVDPEDILLLQPQQHTKNNQPQIEEEEGQQHLEEDLENGRRKSSSQQMAETRRVSGRHSSVEGGMILRVMKTASFRRSLDSAVGGTKKKENGVFGFGRSRKDGMLLLGVERRLEHRIIVSQDDERWSDVQPSDWLYLMSEMIIRREQNNDEGGRGIINSRSVSELTGLSREGVLRQHQRQREEGLVSRWLAWISISKKS